MATQKSDISARFSFYQRLATELSIIDGLEYQLWTTQRMLQKEEEYLREFGDIVENEFLADHTENAQFLREQLAELEANVEDRQRRVDHNLARINLTEFFNYLQQRSVQREISNLEMLDRQIEVKYNSEPTYSASNITAIQQMISNKRKRLEDNQHHTISQLNNFDLQEFAVNSEINDTNDFGFEQETIDKVREYLDNPSTQPDIYSDMYLFKFKKD